MSPLALDLLPLDKADKGVWYRKSQVILLLRKKFGVEGAKVIEGMLMKTSRIRGSESGKDFLIGPCFFPFSWYSSWESSI